jgi:TetR/AcrR family transcriptional regulator, transcriptional repressor for nem operon
VRYEKGHKETTRKHIVKVASERFRRDGIEGTGLAGLMADAGLTHGGFYSHFSAKEELVGEAVNYALKKNLAELHETAKFDGLAGILHNYLHPRHVDTPARGCAFAALTSEIARQSRPTRAAFTQKYGEYIELIMAQLVDSAGATMRRRRALAIFTIMMGTVQFARAVSEKRLSDEILESGIGAAFELAQAPNLPQAKARAKTAPRRRARFSARGGDRAPHNPSNPLSG